VAGVVTQEPTHGRGIAGEHLRGFARRAEAAGLIETFDAEDLTALAARLDPVDRAAGERIRDPSDRSAWLLLTGEIDASYLPASGGRVDLGAILPGTMFGDLALLLDLPEPIELVAKTPCHLARLDRAVFWRWTESGEPAAAHFHHLLARLLARRLRFANARFAALASHEDPDRRSLY
jgi:CRP-like cAMP-binding protein